MNATKASGVRGRPRDADREARLDALIETALRAFLTHGFAGTTIEMIATDAHVAKRTIYATVGDKADLFVAVVRRLGDRAVSPVHNQDRDGGDLKAFCVRLTSLMLSDEAIGLHRLVISEAAQFPDLAERLYRNGAERYIAALEEFVGSAGRAEQLFTLLLGERQRRRLFCLDLAPTSAEVETHVDRTLALFS